MTFRKPSRSLRTHLGRQPEVHSDDLASSAGSNRIGKGRRSRKRRDEKRRSLMENLETRQLLAGPELIGIQPNEGDLLVNGDTLTFSPKELVFRFDDNTQIDESTLDAIRITRAGEDRTFESASVTSDLGTAGQALFEFRARQSGSLGNGITLEFTATNRAGSSAPIITTSDRSVTIDINTNPLQPTLARDLVSAINNDPNASSLIEAIQVSGPSGQRVGINDIDGTTLVLDGANAAQAVTDFGTNGDVRVRLISQLPGIDGRGTSVVVEQRNFGGTANPVVVVSGQTVRVQLNSFVGDPSTANDFVQALNSNPQASRLVQATVQEGDGQTVIGSRAINYSPITLSGVSDVLVQPGFVGLGDSSREVVFRFAEPLPDDIYQIDILGSGTFALRGEDGEAFQDGEDLTRMFNINLGPQVVAVVPEPVRRQSDGTLSANTGIVEVHFNDDNLSQTQAQNVNFYQLIFTRDSVDNRDDEVIRPVSVSYNNITNIATLDFQRPLSRIPDPDNPGEMLSGSARLRIGTSENLPSAPTAINLPAVGTNGPDAAGDNFQDAYNLNATWSLNNASTTRSATLTTEIKNETAFDLDLPGPDVPGTRTIRPDDPSRLDRVVPLDYVRQFADTVDGISVIEYDFVASWLGDDPNRPGINADTNYFNIISEQQQQRVREVMSLFSEYLGVTFIEVADRDPADIGGFSIAVGDLYGGDEREASAQGGLAVVTRDRDGDGNDDLVVMDFQDFDESTDDQFGGEFFRGAMFGVGQLLGYGYADDLPQPTTQSTDFIFQPGTDNEPAFPSPADIVHGQYLYRPDSTDVDMYRFQIDQAGSVSIETIAERLADASLLDTQLRMYRQLPSGQYELIAQNDDYFSNDSLIRIEDLNPGTYMIGVSAAGNDSYDPEIPGTGFGGLSQGTYELRVDFSPAAVSSLTDTTGVALDGDADGTPGGTFNYWFTPSDPSETLYVDKGNVTLNQPTGAIPSNLGDIAFVQAFQTRTIGYVNNGYAEIDKAVADARRISELRQQTLNGTFNELNQLRRSTNPADVQRAAAITTYLTELDLTVRVLGNGGRDGLVETFGDNFSYNIGFGSNGLPLEDGSDLEVPAGVQLILDSGSIIKFSDARLAVGSVAPTIDLSGANLQVLGTPTIVNSNGLPARDVAGAIIPGSVILTSINDSSVGTGNLTGVRPAPLPGDWGGIDFRGDLDAADELRINPEDEGIFANHIQFADMRYGGGAVSIGGRDVVVSPIDMAITRPTIINSSITNSADAAIAASPDSFREDRFTDPKYQQSGRFTPDYERVGPEIHGNTVIDNSINGLFIRLSTRSGQELETVSTSTRFDDSDITHVLTENLVISGTPGGPILQSGAPSSFLIRLTPVLGDGAVPAGSYVYRLTNVTDSNLESAASDATVAVTTTGTGGIRLQQLPTVAPGSATVSRRLYRATIDPTTGQPGAFELVAQLNASATTYTDRAAIGTAPLQLTASPLRSRLDASLVIDPSTVLKVDSARIEARFGANLIAEGTSGNPVVITSLEDQRYGAGGTFDTGDRGVNGELNPGDWGGLYIGHGSTANIDNAVIAGAGGTTRIEGGFASFNAIEVHQGDLRLTNSRIENNADGRGTLNDTRVGRGDNAPGAVFIRAATPIIVDNDFIDNDAAAITIDVNSLNSTEVNDSGRATGRIGNFEVVGNSGPLVEDNTLTRNDTNGMVVRGGELVTEGVWDDVDMVHVVTDSVEVPNQHIYGGLRLVSDARGSLVVKFETANEGDPAGIVVGGSLLTAADEFRDIADRIGGALRLVGHPDFPVVLTTLQDDFAGAGFTIDGMAQVDTNNDGIIGGDLSDQAGTLPTGPEVNLGTTIDNDVDPTITGSFGATIGDAGEVGFASGGGSAVTVEDLQNNQQLIGQDFIFQYNTYLTSGGTSVALAATTITQAATLIADDVVESRGTYAGPNGDVEWIATSSFRDGVATLFTSLELSSATAFGDIRVISYLDEDVLGISDDVLYTTGTPGESDFRLYTIDGALRVGFSHGGFYANDGQNQQNAVYEGWAADQYNELETQIIAGTQTFSIAGDIDLVDLPGSPDATFGTVYGPNDVTTAHSWLLDSAASSAQVTNFLELIAADPVLRNPRFQVESGKWNGVVIREGADDRNVAAAAEQEPVRTTVFDTNSIPSQAQFLGEIAPDQQSGDENRRLGFVVDGVIATRDDVDVYSFIGESNTEVWLDIDRTSNSLDTVIELIDFNGQVLAASNDSLLAERDPSTGLYVSPRLDPDAAQPLTVNEDRLSVQRITVDQAIDFATGGNLTLGLVTGSGLTVNVDALDFVANPAGSIAAALNSTFSAELGFVTTQLLSRGASDDYVVEVHFQAEFFTGLEVPEIRGTSNPVSPSIAPLEFETLVQTSVLQDTYSYNAKDAGMRIRLPGESGTRNLYHIRVRSSNTRDGADFNTLINGDVLGGLTQGSYSMQVRLQEADESAGTQISLSDVRYATNGVQIIGQPLHSPLLGEEYETTESNETASEAQRLGYYGTDSDVGIEAGPLQSDRLAKSFAGEIDSATDVDWYQFDIQYDNLTRDGAPLLLSTVIDLDYASNFARSDMALYVFDSTGALIYTGTDSNVAEDLPASRNSNSTDDLSRGGAGTEDPFIGSVELGEGTYYVAVANQTQVPLAMDQFFNPASANPLVRLAPIQAIDRIAVDNMSNRVLFDETSIVPYSMDDVVVYVNTSSGLFAVNPFTGQNYGQVGNFGSDDIYDVAFRSNGELYAYTGFGDRQRSDTSWFYVQIDTGTAALDQISTGAGITTYGDTVVEDNNNPQILDAVANEGVFVEALSIREYKNTERGLFVGSRPILNGSSGLEYRQNVLWEFSPQTGLAVGPSYNRFLSNAGAGTIPREIGQIDTTAPATAQSTQLGVSNVLEIGANGYAQQTIVDGDVFTLVSGQDTTTFEFDFNGDVAATGAPILDGDTLTIGSSIFEFDTGSRLRINPVTANGGLNNGQTVTVSDVSGFSQTFEFINQGDTPSGNNIPIVIRLANGQIRATNTIATSLGLAIQANMPTVTATVLGSDVAFGPGTTFVNNGAGLAAVGSVGVAPGNITIAIDESASSSEIIDTIVTELTNNSIAVTTNGPTFAVPGASSIEINSQALVGGGTSGVDVGRTAISISLTDTAPQIAQKVADAINAVGGNANATAQNRSVGVSGGFIASASGTLVAGGVPAGGTVTGVEILGNDMYAITDAGGLFRVTDAELTNGGNQFVNGNRTIGTYVQTATDLLRVGSSFTGLRAGPNSVDGGIYSNVLFGITASGDIYAFNSLGELLPYFAGGRSMISTGIANAEGLDFSTLDYNLWHYTNNRSGDAGHDGGTSLAFTYETSFQSNYDSVAEYPTNVGRRDGQGVNNTYNFPGGAKGQVQSKEFSLEGYSPSDVPMLYFNYKIEADGGNSTDALRVYVIQPDGTEHGVALNTTGRNSGASDDEFDDPQATAPYNDVIDVDKQQLFDNTPTWRQARVPLAEFAGQAGLSLRIEFATAGTLDTNSSAIRGVAAADLVEGQTLVVNRETFTVDFPPTLVAPAGTLLASTYAADPAARATFQLDGQTYVLNDGTRTIDSSPLNPADPLSPPTEISIDLTSLLTNTQTIADLSSADIAAIIQTAVAAMPPSTLITYQVASNGNAVEFGAADALITAEPNLVTVRNADPAPANPINVRAGMSASDVATAIQAALTERFLSTALSANGLDYIPTSNAIVSVPGYTVDNYGPFANTSLRYEDDFGLTPVQGSRDNDFEGVYLDDFVIGLAERGEQVSDQRAADAPLDTAFVTDQRFTFPQPDDPRSNLVTGSYQVEIRDGSEYITSSNLSQFRTFDSNDRLSDALSIVARSSDEILDGQMFSITDGRATVEFEFDSDNVVTPGRVQIPFEAEITDPVTGVLRPQNATEVAKSIIGAINRVDVRSVLDIQAVPSSGFENEVVPTAGIKEVVRLDPRINLIGDVVVSDATRSLAEIDQSNLRGDQNRERSAQGVIMIESSRFLFNQEYGIDISHNVTTTVAGNDTPSIVRYPRNLVELNTEDLVPGVVVQSNIFAFNSVGGLQLQGIDDTLQQTNGDPVPIERIVNNTIIGGSVATGATAPPERFDGVLFDQGRISFADAVVEYEPNAGGSPPDPIHQTPDAALGIPDCNGRGPEPADGQFAVSLGLGGTLTLQFVDNYLTGSGDSQADLAIFETGEIESVRVEISRDGTNFIDVGIVGGLTNQLDIDAFGFDADDRFSFVRLTDLRQGDTNVASLGADIDAVGAMSSVPVDQFTPGGVGINIVGGSSPTVLNNVISNSETGISVTGGNGGFVSGGNSYYQNTNNTSAGVGLGTLPQVLTPTESVFVDPGSFVFSPASGARIIDSSIDSLPDRASLTTVRNAIGIDPSPVLAPRLDVNGQLRVDDPNVEPPSGLGERVFKDRGGFDRGDLTGPRVTLLSPLAPGIGLDAGRTTVLGAAPQAFEIQLVDGLPPADIVPGTGIDDRSVSSGSLILLKDGVALVEGTDYRFAYNPSTNIIRLTPIAGVWEQDSTYVIRMVDSSDAIVQAGDGDIYNDGDRFTVIDEVGQSTTFEYETGVGIELSSGLTTATADGITVEVYDGSITRQFELDSNNAVSPLSIAVPIPAAGDATDFAAALAAAIDADPLLSFTARSSGPLVQLVGGTPLSSATSASGSVQVSGQIGTDIGFGFQIPTIGNSNLAQVNDGDSIIVRLGAVNEVTFEFDTNGLLNDTSATAVTISDNATLDQVADALVRSIGGSGLGLAPENVGFGRVFLGGDNTYSIDLSNSNLVQTGLAGEEASVAVEIPIDLPAEQIAALIQQAIDSQNLAGIESSLVDVRVFLEGTRGVSGVGAVDSVIVQDQVGNQLQSNQADGRTELTIFIGTGYDYGDAPAPYVSLMADGGPRHRVDPLLSLGNENTADSDAELPNADSGDDGISLPSSFQSGFSSMIGIYLRNLDAGQASDKPVYLDAWFDWDQDGLFESQERVRFGTTGTSLTPIFSNTTTNVLIDVPASALTGETYARFRLSESATLGPNGDAESGEVEDYRIFVSNNPFQNPTNRYDANDNGTVTPLDALQVINALARNGSTSGEVDLETNPVTTPPYPDVNGDGRLTSSDALAIINELARVNTASGEGESVGTNYVAAVPGVLASGSTLLGDMLIHQAVTSDLLASSRPAEPEQEPAETADVSTVQPEASKTSVFDSPESIGLDSIVDQLAADTASVADESDELKNGVDDFFATL
ncbi:GEVED domain-containing protein [Stieleria sp. TO1_6]|uniref:GEVED domain-containing protein n=1 Tax=Stieleria tagensis TaxID=2956795 RepID=UPI00209AE523|nr:GEVED domain-containing protein [Stieleria tagensis]MCO8123946.1 GEVED domain-containing protein [Stieleria tagensis]